jgi:hypothetical protein
MCSGIRSVSFVLERMTAAACTPVPWVRPSTPLAVSATFLTSGSFSYSARISPHSLVRYGVEKYGGESMSMRGLPAGSAATRKQEEKPIGPCRSRSAAVSGWDTFGKIKAKNAIKATKADQGAGMY